MNKFLYIILALIVVLWIAHPYAARATNTYATLNPADCNAGMTLSNGNLTVKHTAANSWIGCRATIGVSSGKWYWELHYDSGASDNSHGVGDINAVLTSYVGKSATGWAYYSSDGSKQNNDVAVAYGASQVSGDTVGVALDRDAGTITMYKNNVSQGVMYSGLSGTIYPMMSEFELNNQWTANFGATPLTYSPPAGYNAGLYTTSNATVNQVIITNGTVKVIPNGRVVIK